ncbi:hypothetical protein TrRE_jg3931 [Triparma retinervis]|uniref:Serine-threonine/tyrosine-protein kinase catalytic domain-containing protein n=1 Tax=Triparma retinervis TaxID=2557542 RepID=A0A9W7FFT7_9STRA|nr:hypothetical protein TrRE_jg3931 [Triparma retinervis]
MSNCYILSPCEYPSFLPESLYKDIGLTNPELGLGLTLLLLLMIIGGTSYCCWRRRRRRRSKKDSRDQTGAGPGQDLESGRGSSRMSGRASGRRASGSREYYHVGEDTEGMQLARGVKKGVGGERVSRVGMELRKCRWDGEDKSLGMAVSMAPGGGAVVKAVNPHGKAKAMGVREGDAVFWPNSGGSQAPYWELQKLIGDNVRPLEIEVMRRIDEVEREGGEEAGIEFASDADGHEAMRVNKAMKGFKQGEIADNLMPVRFEFVKAHRRQKDGHKFKDAGALDKNKLPKGGWYSWYDGAYNGITAISIKRLQLHGSEKEMMRALEGWGETVRMQSSLRHPNVLSLLSTVFELNLLASIYEGVVAGTMGDLMKGKHLKWKDTSMAAVAEGVAEGMNHVHSKGRPHGFLNPECVVFGMGMGVKKLVGDCTGPMGSRPGFGAIIKRLRGEVRREVSAPYKRSGLAAGPTRSAEGQGSSKAASEGKAASEVRQPTAPGAGAKEKADATAAPADAPAAAGGLASPTKQNLQDTEVEDIVSSDSESDGSSSDSDSDVAL